MKTWMMVGVGMLMAGVCFAQVESSIPILRPAGDSRMQGKPVWMRLQDLNVDTIDVQMNGLTVPFKPMGDSLKTVDPSAMDSGMPVVQQWVDATNQLYADRLDFAKTVIKYKMVEAVRTAEQEKQKEEQDQVETVHTPGFSVPVGVTATTPTDADAGQSAALLGFQFDGAHKYAGANFSFGEKPAISSGGELGTFALQPSAQPYSGSLAGAIELTRVSSKTENYGVLRLYGRTSVALGTFEREYADPNNSDSTLTETFDTSLWYLAGGFQLISENLVIAEENTARIGMEIGIAMRRLMGAAVDEEEYLKDTFDLNNTAWFGGEFTAFARINSFRPFFRVAWTPRVGNSPHIGGWHAFIGVDVVSAFFKSDYDSSVHNMGGRSDVHDNDDDDE